VVVPGDGLAATGVASPTDDHGLAAPVAEAGPHIHLSGLDVEVVVHDEALVHELIRAAMVATEAEHLPGRVAASVRDRVLRAGRVVHGVYNLL
jgi:hypothetical protein